MTGIDFYPAIKRRKQSETIKPEKAILISFAVLVVISILDVYFDLHILY